MTDRNNRPALDDLGAMPPGEIAALPADQLALLHEEAMAAVENARILLDRLEAGIALRYADRAGSLRRAQGKDSGTVRFEDGEVTVISDLPKRIEWDQDRLAALMARIRDGGDDPAQYVETILRVPERKYTAWPAHLRDIFAPARTAGTGKPRYRLSLCPKGGS